MSETIQLIPGNSLLTKTPEEGRLLVIKIARLVIKATQPDAAVRVQPLLLTERSGSKAG